MTKFQDFCTELVRAIDSYPLKPKAHRDLCNKVRAELKRAQLNEPTDTELCETYLAGYYAHTNRQGPACQAAGLRAVLNHYR